MNYLDLVRSVLVGTYAAGRAAAAVVGKLLSWAAEPFRCLWAVLSFVLSPLWFLGGLARSATLLAIGLAVRFRYVYIYFACAAMIGLLAALVLHGTSSILFVVLRLHPSQQPKARHHHRHHPLGPAAQASSSSSSSSAGARPPEPAPGRRRIAGGVEEEDDDDVDVDDDDLDYAGSSALETSSSGRAVGPATGSAPGLLRNRRGGRDPSSAVGNLYGSHWRALSDQRKAPAKSHRRGKLKGLLAQTIHEESSESESL